MGRFNHQKVLVMGAGRSGLAAARLLLREGAQVVLADDKSAEEIRKKSTKYGGIPDGVSLAPSGRGQGEGNFVVLSPGVPRSHPLVQQALQNNISVINELELAAQFLSDCQFVGITGTNGKSTTTTLLGSILTQVDPDVFIGGNLGLTLCETVLMGKKPRLGVIELSSFQLETIHQLALQVAVITNLSPDHLDRYPSVNDYYAAKERIFDLLVPGGTPIRGPLDISQYDVEVHNPHLIGAHNLENAAAAIAAALALGISRETIEQGLAAYKGIAHRLECLGKINGVLWVNDTKATNIDAAIIAVKAFSGGIHLIAGGLGKGSDYAPWVQACLGRVKTVYTIGDDAAKIEQAFAGKIPVVACRTLAAAVANAQKNAISGDVILLAPACASYDQFEDYAQRGEVFRTLFLQAHKGL